MTVKSMTLTQTRIAHGRWEGELSGATGQLPAIEAVLQGQVLDGLAVTPIPGQAGAYSVVLPIPLSVLSEGVQTILLRAGGAVLAQVTLIVGVPLEEDLRAEISLMRAELDLLKQAFRRHCADAPGPGGRSS